MLVKDIIKPKVLIVEDEEDHAFLLNLEVENFGYQSVSATNVKDAIDLLNRGSIHCIILDLSLTDKEYHTEGFEILKFLDEQSLAIPVIVITQHPNADKADRTYDAYRELIVRFLSKKSLNYWEDVRSALKKAIEVRTKINWDLKIEYHNGLNLEEMTRNLDDTPNISQELIELIGRVYPTQKKVEMFPLTQGFSGAGVVKVTPSMEIGNNQIRMGEMEVLKYGIKQKIKREGENYVSFVAPFMRGNRRTSLLGEPVYTLSLGAIRYSLIGTSSDQVMSFFDIYKTENTPEIKRILENLFNETCAVWYSDKSRVFITPYEKYEGEKLELRLKKWAEHNQPTLIYEPIISFPELDHSFENPLMQFMHIGRSEVDKSL